MAGLEEHAEEYEEAGVRIVALSADEAEGAREMVSDEELSFPVLYGLDVEDSKDRFGLYIQKGDKTHLQPAQFVLDPDGVIRLACYSSGAVGRLSATEILGVVDTARG